MTMYYKDGGFYDDSFEGFVPEGACEISDETYRLLIEGQSAGKQIIEDSEGKPMLVERQPSPYHLWDGKAWVISAEQQAVKNAEDIAKVREQINALRDRKINGGVYVAAVGKWLDTDATAERNLLSVKASFDLFGDELGEIAWSCADNSILRLNKEKLMLIWQALMQAKTGNHANALRHKAAVEQAENPLDYDYSAGWTKTYAEYLAEQTDE